MKTLTVIAVLIAIPLLALALIPVLTVGLTLLATGGFFLIWLLPIIIIAVSDRTCGAEKAAWILAIIFLSWFAWVFYFLLAPLKSTDRYSY